MKYVIALQVLVSTARLALNLAALLITGILILHTLHLLGRRTVLYTKRRPVAHWNRRFYPACLILIGGLLLLWWWLGIALHGDGYTNLL